MSTNHSPTNEGEELRRAACDECRLKKARCTGEIPTCSRCAGRGAYCSYSIQKPRGRPKRSRLDPLARILPPENDMNMPERPNISGPSPQSAQSQSQDDQWAFANPPMDAQGGGDLMPFMGELCELPHTYDLLHLPVDSEPTPSSGGHQRQSCVCLYSLTQMMDKIRNDEDLPFPSNLRLLREALRSATVAIDCQVCPRLFVTAMQNGLLLCTAVISVAQGYVKIARQIDQEATRCIQLNQMKVLDVKDSFSQDVETFALETSPQQWKLLALKMVRAEVFGVTDGSRPCFLSSVAQLERRQKSWHADPPGAFFPDSYRTTDDSPSCLRLLKDARGIIACLDDGLCDSPSPPTLG